MEYEIILFVLQSANVFFSLNCLGIDLECVESGGEFFFFWQTNYIYEMVKVFFKNHTGKYKKDKIVQRSKKSVIVASKMASEL